MWMRDGPGRAAAEATLTEPIGVDQCLRIIAEEDASIPTLTTPCGNMPWPKLGQAGGCVFAAFGCGRLWSDARSADEIRKGKPLRA